MSLMIDESGKLLTETIDGVTMPADYTFATVNDFVHGKDVHFEDLQSLCLGMAAHFEKMQERLHAAEAELFQSRQKSTLLETKLGISDTELGTLRVHKEAAEGQEPYGYFLPDQGGNVFTRDYGNCRIAERFNWPVVKLYTRPVPPQQRSGNSDATGQKRPHCR